jgi:hypothetical protein
MIQYITRGDAKCVLKSYFEGDEYDKKRREDLTEIYCKARNYGFITDSSEHGDIHKACKKLMESKEHTQ